MAAMLSGTLLRLNNGDATTILRTTALDRPVAVIGIPYASVVGSDARRLSSPRVSIGSTCTARALVTSEKCANCLPHLNWISVRDSRPGPSKSYRKAGR